MLAKIYQNTPSALIALTRLDPSCQLVSSSFKMLACSLSLGGTRSFKSKVALAYAPFSNPCLGEEALIMHSLQRSMKEVQGGFFKSNIRTLMTLVMTSIIIAPVPITLLALLYQSSMLSLLPIIVSLFYGVSLQLILLVFKRYMKFLV
ncbi:MAG: hypothetical protein QW826_04300 [Candidatus Nezhaarchaeales archaeon]